MKLSVVIVNYNVEHFLEQCLYSVEAAGKGVDMEVWVVDNASVDGSEAMVKEKFPWAKWVGNTQNVGFSKANNQAIRESSGEYVLLLNPDTVVQEDTFRQVIRFMDDHPDAGGLGVKMVDGKGHFLPESKRGLPTPWVAFYKIFGLSSIFSRSSKFNRYYLGHLSNEETHEIEILSGAFMWMRKEALDKVGLLDEAFFMYGEDIDLSWRIIQGGYKNYYFPHTRIIHYKGESTKKGSLNYVFVFYQAMIIFAKKHFEAQHAKLFSMFIQIAIYLRAALAILMRFVKQIWLPVVDFLLIFGLMWLLKDYYATLQQKVYDPGLARWAFGSYALIWILSVFFSGGYDKPIRMTRIFKGVAIGSAVILIGYALLPEELRFSRALILLGTIGVGVCFAMSRAVLARIFPSGYAFDARMSRRFAIVASEEEFSRIRALLVQTHYRPPVCVAVSPDEHNYNDAVGNVNQLDEVVRVHKLNAVVFSGKDMGSSTIIDQMSALQVKGLDFKIAPPESLSIIGSNSIDTSGDLFILDTNSVDKPANRRNKRLFDVIMALLLLVCSPVVVWFVRKKGGFFRNLLQVLWGTKSWVGYAKGGDQSIRLPKLKPGVLTPSSFLPSAGVRIETTTKLNIVYAKNYRLSQDLNMVVKGVQLLGN